MSGKKIAGNNGQALPAGEAPQAANNLPRVPMLSDEQPPESSSDESPESKSDESPESKSDDSPPLASAAIIKVPLAAEAGGYVSRQVNVRLDLPAARTLDRLYRALDQERVRLADGKPLRHRVDAVRWLLDQIAAAPQFDAG